MNGRKTVEESKSLGLRIKMMTIMSPVCLRTFVAYNLLLYTVFFLKVKKTVFTITSQVMTYESFERY